MKEPWGIHWFRRDLRLAGNEALGKNWKRTSGRTLGIFCFDAKFLSRQDFSHHRFAFFIKTLRALKGEFRAKGGDLLVVDQLPMDFYSQLLSDLKLRAYPLPSIVTWARDYEPFARKRDQNIEALLSRSGITVETARDHLLFEPQEIRKESDGSYYQIYSPFGRRWFTALQSEVGQARIEAQAKAKKYLAAKEKREALFHISWPDVLGPHHSFSDQLDIFDKENHRHVTIPIPEAGLSVAYKKLRDFSDRISNYNETRDWPADDGTSQLSLYLKNGSLTVTQILHELSIPHLNWNQISGPVRFVKELAWREFYYHILYHRPDVETNAFQRQYDNLKWENNKIWFERWKEGSTGFPIVDAGMRQLNTTGWMHNRVRMIVASFLTKDLLIDWRWGENYFMRQLLDGDLAANNGGWQWAASTGCDPQPYFRIFNPWLQSKKFDSDGRYIKKFIPELKDAPISALHDPQADRSIWNYPTPIVDHFVQKTKALKLYQL